MIWQTKAPDEKNARRGYQRVFGSFVVRILPGKGPSPTNHVLATRFIISDYADNIM
jgi:hypothetical protein